MTDVATTVDITYTKLHITMRNHANPLLQDEALDIPPPKNVRRLKKKKTPYRQLITNRRMDSHIQDMPEEHWWATQPQSISRYFIYCNF